LVVDTGGGVYLPGGGVTLRGTRLVSLGAAALTSSDSNRALLLAGGAAFENRGTLTMDHYASLDHAPGDTTAVRFVNGGSVVKPNTPAWASLGVPIDSSGSFSVLGGELDL